MPTLIAHPRAALLTPAADFAAAIESGHWGAAARLVDAQLGYLRDVESCAADLDALFASSGYVSEDEDPVGWNLSPDGSAITFEASPRQTAGIIDLFTRVLVGQWREIDWVTRMNAVSLGEKDASAIGGQLDQLRVKHQKPGTYPDFAGASWGVHHPMCGDATHLGYAVWKALGQGVAGRETPAFDGVVPTVHDIAHA